MYSLVNTQYFIPQNQLKAILNNGNKQKYISNTEHIRLKHIL